MRVGLLDVKTAEIDERLYVLWTDLLRTLVHLFCVFELLRLLIKKSEIDVCAKELRSNLHRFLQKLYRIRVMPFLQFVCRLVVVLNSLLRKILFQLRYVNDVGVRCIDPFSGSLRVSQTLEKNSNGCNAATVPEHVDHLPRGLKTVAIDGDVIRPGLHVPEFEIADGIRVDAV